MKREKTPGPKPGRGAGSIFVRQEERGYAPVGLGDDPEAVIAVAFRGLGGINRVGRKDTKALMGGLVVRGGILGANNAPIAAKMTAKALKPRWPLQNPPLVAGSKSPRRQ